jgi:hypothetical protein
MQICFDAEADWIKNLKRREGAPTDDNIVIFAPGQDHGARPAD